MKIAFIGHSYHKRTGSSRFFVDLLQRLGRVSTFYDESWRGDPGIGLRAFDPNEFDCIVIWQMTEAFRYIRKPHPNVLFVPMYDAMVAEGRSIRWSEAFNNAKVLCFSSELFRTISRQNPRSIYLQYCPDPSQFPVESRRQALRGIFWNRIAAIDETLIARLCGDAVFDLFTLHRAPDPLSGTRVTGESPIRTRTGRISRWWTDRRDYLAEVAQHNVFFAPRIYEGIGMSVLEAMAMGLCVVATDRPTHNEYIAHRRNGILYDPTDVRSVSLTLANELGFRARESVEKGFLKWSAAQDELMNFVALPTDAFGSMLTRCSA